MRKIANSFVCLQAFCSLLPSFSLYKPSFLRVKKMGGGGGDKNVTVMLLTVPYN